MVALFNFNILLALLVSEKLQIYLPELLCQCFWGRFVVFNQKKYPVHIVLFSVFMFFNKFHKLLNLLILIYKLIVHTLPKIQFQKGLFVVGAMLLVGNAG
ncbi:hypothetical protein C2D57_12500 [Escherichia coli]|nr:hypothetical protein [Escherichia coli]EFO3791152.1 hypothetical protein [Escherichia coli]